MHFVALVTGFAAVRASAAFCKQSIVRGNLLKRLPLIEDRVQREHANKDGAESKTKYLGIGALGHFGPLIFGWRMSIGTRVGALPGKSIG